MAAACGPRSGMTARELWIRGEMLASERSICEVIRHLWTGFEPKRRCAMYRGMRVPAAANAKGGGGETTVVDIGIVLTCPTSAE